MSWKEYFVYTIDNTSLPAGTGVTFTDTNINIDSDSDFEFYSRSHVVSDNRIYCTFKDDSYGRFYSNEKLNLRAISSDHSSVGTIIFFKPTVLKYPIGLKATSVYTGSFSDFSGVANSIRLALHGSKFRNGNAPWEGNWKSVIPFEYTANLSLVANQTLTTNLNISTDAHFLVKSLTAVFTGSALITIKDVVTGKQWMNLPVHINNIFGTGFYPNDIPSPRFINKGSTISITVQDISNTTNDISLLFTGKKLFD